MSHLAENVELFNIVFSKIILLFTYQPSNDQKRFIFLFKTARAGNVRLKQLYSIT